MLNPIPEVGICQVTKFVNIHLLLTDSRTDKMGI